MIEQRVTLRYDAQQIPAIVQAVQGDTGRDVIFELADYEIPAGATANYYIDKPDDTAIYNSAEVISSTEILAHLTEQALAVPGRNNGQVRILADGEVITSFDFVLEVEAFRGILRLQSETEVNIFDEALQAAATETIAEAVEEIQEQTPVVTGMQNSIAPTYSSSSTYSVGDYVMYNAQLYRCITAITTAEAWTEEHWTQANVTDDVGQLNDRISDVADGNAVAFLNNVNYLSGKPIAGYYNDYTGAGIRQNVDWSYYPLFEIEGGFYYCASYNGAHVAFYDESKEFISGVLVNNTVSNFDFLAPEEAKYAIYSYLTASGEQYFMRSTKQAIAYSDPKFKTLGFNVSLEPFHFLDIIHFGKNLFNKFNVINGFCLDYGNGARIWRNSNYCYCPDYIPAKPLTSYYRNRPCIIVEYDDELNALVTHNYTATYSGSFTTNSSTAFLRIGTLLTHTDTLQVEEGTAESDYQEFGYSLNHALNKVSIHTVKKDGSGDYQTISDAVAASGDDDIILVYPGTYLESVHSYAKRVHIIGMNRKTCVLSYSGLDYAQPTLEMAKGSVRNITILATNSGSEASRPAYCVHIDNDNEAGEALSFFNVDFINEVHQAVGIGLRADFTLTFDSCRFKANDQAALYCHDWETSDSSADKTGQTLIVRNCSIVNSSESKASIMLQSQELVDKGATAVFIGNTVANTVGSSLISMTLWAGRTLTNDNFLGSSDWVLSIDSNLNTLDTINNSGNNIAYTSVSPILNRVGDIEGGYCKIGRIVYVNITFKCLADHLSTPSILGAFPKPLNNNSVLACVKASNGIGSSMQEVIMCGINNTTMFVNKINTNDVYYVTGVYISEE